MTDQPIVPDRITLTRGSLATLLARHATLLADGYRTEAAVCLPGYRDGLHAAADKAARHATRLTAVEESTVVAELLDGMLTTPGSEQTPMDRDALRQRIADTARTVPLRLGPNAVGMAQRGEPIILNMSEADDLADRVLDVVLPALAGQTTDRAAVLREAADAVFALDYDDMVSEQDDENLGSMRQAWDLGTIHATELLRRLADDEQPAAGARQDGAQQ